jgi:hypothetical protein
MSDPIALTKNDPPDELPGEPSRDGASTDGATTDRTRTAIRRRPAVGTLRKRARAAVARSAAGDRGLAMLIGLLLLAAGSLVALLSLRVFGVARAGRPLLDPMIVDVLRAEPLISRAAAIGIGVLLVLLGITWTARSVRPERRPDLLVDGGRPETTIVVSATATAGAVADQAAALPGVSRAKAKLLGSPTAPALRLTLWLTEDADVRDLLGRIDDTVLASARRSLDLPALPVAVRLELDAPATPPRVA